jgi:hypothetical protein
MALPPRTLVPVVAACQQAFAAMAGDKEFLSLA